MADLLLHPIAYIETDFDDKFGIPRQSGRVESLIGTIVFEKEYRNKDALEGLESFTHLWLLFDFSQSHQNTWSPTVRPPRLGGNKRMGVFASRSPFRPNPIGLSCVRLKQITDIPGKGTVLIVEGVDLLNGTPILDIKPYIPYTDSRPEATGSYSDAFKNYKLDVVFPENLLSKVEENKQTALIGCLAEDPRPSYHHDKNRIYSMKFSHYDIRFHVEENILTVTEVIVIN